MLGRCATELFPRSPQKGGETRRGESAKESYSTPTDPTPLASPIILTQALNPSRVPIVLVL